MVLKNQHDKSPGHAILTLLQQGLTSKEICVLVEAWTRERRKMLTLIEEIGEGWQILGK